MFHSFSIKPKMSRNEFTREGKLTALSKLPRFGLKQLNPIFTLS